MQIKIFTYTGLKENFYKLENEVNDFIKDKEVKTIQQSIVLIPMHGYLFSITVLYQ